MNPAWILLPLLIHVALVLCLYAALAVAKARARRAGEVDLERAPLHPDAWPDAVIKINNNIRNQFEAPVVFYALVFAILAVDQVHAWSVALAWLFITSRVVHAYVHTGPNVVPVRRPLFILGVVTLAGLLVAATRGVFLLL